MKTNHFSLIAAMFLSLFLFACGGSGEITSGNLPSSGTGGGGPTIPGTDPTLATVGSVTLAYQGGAQEKTLVASGLDTAIVKATVRDEDGAILAGKTVYFYFTSGSGTFVPTSTVTDEFGVAAINLQSSTSIGDNIIVASADTVDSTAITATYVAGAPAVMSLNANPTQIGTDGTTDLFARVKDAYGHLLGNTDITFSSNDNSEGTLFTLFSPQPTITTDANGLSEVAYTSGNFAAVDTITATAGAATATININVVDTPVIVSSLFVTLNPTTVAADGITSVSVTATVIGELGGAAEDVPVSFSLSDTAFGSITAITSLTNTNGDAFANFTAGTSSGVVTIIVDAGGFTKTTALTLTAGTASSLTMVANPTNIVVGAQAQLEATVVDSNLNPVKDESVLFSRAFGGSGSDLTDQQVITNASGKAKLIYTAGPTPGTDIFTASLPNIANVVEPTVSVAVASDDTQIESINIVDVLPGDLLSTGTSATLIVEALGSGGTPLEDVTLTGFVSGSAILTGPTPLTTDIFGRTVFTVTNTAQEVVEVRITGGAASATQVLNFGPPIDLTLAATPAQVIADGLSTISITATVVGANGGVDVNFSLSNALGTLSQSTVTTVNGDATTIFNAGVVAGTTTIIAEASGFAKTLTLTLTPATATTMTLNAVPSATVNAADTVQIVAIVTDDNNNGILGESITFTLDSNQSESGFNSSTVTTDGRGFATLDYPAGTVPGIDIIAATPANSGVNTANISITVQPDSANITGITIETIDPGTLLAAGSSADVTVTVNGAGGPLEGIVLNAVSTGSSSVPALLPATDQFGQTTFTFTDAVAENVVLRVSGGTITVQQTFNFGPTLTLTPIAVTAVGSTVLTAVLRDADGVSMPGQAVDFIVTFPVTPDDNDNIVTSFDTVTDANGIGTATVEDTSDNGGSVIIVAIDSNGQISSPASTVTFQTEADSFDLAAEATLSAVTTTGVTTIIATVTNQADSAPAALQPVTFATTGAATLSSAAENTDSTGKASVTLTGTVGETVTVTVASGLNVVNIPVYFGAGLQLNPADSQSIANGTTAAPLTATVYDAGNAVITGIPVNFSVTTGSALLSAGQIMTDDLGNAPVTVTNSVLETAVVEANVGDLAPVTADITFLPGEPANVVLTSAPINTTPLSLFGTATITATVTDILGNNVVDNFPVTFVAAGTATNAIVAPESTTASGVATADLSAGNVTGSILVTVTAGSISETINFTVASSDAGTIWVDSVNPEFVQMLGQSGSQTSVISFAVKDPGGNPVADGTLVDVSLDPLQLGGGELLSDGLSAYATTVTTQTVAGLASVTFRSGVVSGTVDITATVATPLSADISSVAQVTVVSGQPDSLHLPVSGAPLNVPARIYDGCTSDFNITVGDRYGNPVPDGTNVSFMVEPGCGLIGTSQGFDTTTIRGDISEIFNHAQDQTFPSLPISDEPLCTVVAYMQGDEGYEDLNGNGIWEAGEPCTGDLGEPYADANNSGSYDIGELYVDVNANNSYDVADGSCVADTIIWRSFDYLQTGNVSFGVAPGTFALEVGASESFTVIVSDSNGAPPVAGTQLEVTTSAGTLLNGGVSVIGDTNVALPWSRSFTLLSGIDPAATPELAVITIALTYSEGACSNNGPSLSTQIAGVINQAPVVPAAAPTVSFTVPADTATNVAADSEVTIFFSEPMNTLTVTGASVSADCILAGPFNLGPVTASSDDQAFTFKPAAPFTAADSCTVTVAGSVRDVDDDLPMGADSTFTFGVQ